MRRRGLSTEQITHALQLYTDGHTSTDLAAHFGVDERALCRAPREHGLTLRGPQGRPATKRGDDLRRSPNGPQTGTANTDDEPGA